MNRTDIRGEQLKLLKILKAFDAFCKEHDIKYYMAFGAMLGAVREKGFIPWDGDIDLMMSYEQYEKLNMLAIAEGGINGYAWRTYKTDKHIPTFFAKIFEPGVNAEHLEDFSYIEVAPFTKAPEKEWLQKIVWRTSLLNYDIYWVKNRIYKNNMGRKHNKIGMAAKIALFWWPSALSRKYFESCLKKWEGSSKAFYLTCLYNTKRTTIPARWLEEDPVYVDFEDMKVPVIKEYDKYLTQLYGDYMTPVQYDRYKEGTEAEKK